MSGQLVGGRQRIGRASTENGSRAGAAWARRIALLAAAVLFAAPEPASAQSFWNWGAGDNPPSVRQRRGKIKHAKDPAEAVAKNAAKPVGPLVISVSIEKQRLRVYDVNGLFAESAVSTGTKSHPTPMGVFSIIQKNKHHVSNLYNASMPYMQRITWSGVAMHTGVLPGYAASHGCIRMPNEFATRLWTWTKMGTRVIVAPNDVPPANFSHPKLVTKMVPLPTVSAAPASSAPVVTAEAAPARAPQRTADARDAIDGIRGTLTDVAPSSQVEDKPKDTPKDAANEPKTIGTDTVVETPPTVPVETKTAVEAEIKPRTSAQKAFSAAKGENEDSDSPALTTATVEEPAAKPAQVEKSAEATPEPKAPADIPQDIAKPADIMKPVDVVAPAKPTDVAKPADAAKPAEVATPAPEPAKPATAAAPVVAPEAVKPADVAAPTVAPEPAKPVVAAPPRRHNHVAVFISRKDKKLYIRHGYEPVYDTDVEIADPDRPLGTHVFTARGDKDDDKALLWSVVSLPQVPRRADMQRLSKQDTRKPQAAHASVIAPLDPTAALDRITIPAEALEKIASIISPGGSVLISDNGLNGWETGKGTDFIVPLR